MPDREELEQQINNMLDDNQEYEQVRAAIRKLYVERLDEIFKKEGAED